jgi:hypothetical protein
MYWPNTLSFGMGYPTLREEYVRDAAKAVLELRRRGKFRTIDGKYEKTIQYVLFGYLQCKVEHMQMEFGIKNARGNGTKRIDLRYAAPNAGYIEVATIAERGYNVEHQPERNKTELSKLSLPRFALHKYKKYLLVMDFLNDKPLPEKKFKAAYRKYWTQLGTRLRRKGRRIMGFVTVIYAHPDDQFSVRLRKQILRS